MPSRPYSIGTGVFLGAQPQSVFALAAVPVVLFIRIDVLVGASLAWCGDRTAYMRGFKQAVEGLDAEGHFPP